MQCIHCQSELYVTPSKDAFCKKCNTYYSKREIENIQDAEMMNDDMKYYKQAMQFKGRE